MIRIQDLTTNQFDSLNEHYVPNTTIYFWETMDGNWQVFDDSLQRAMNKYLYWVNYFQLRYRVNPDFNFPSLQSALDAYNKSLEK